MSCITQHIIIAIITAALLVTSQADSSQKQNESIGMMRPDLMKTFTEMRKNCQWRKSEEDLSRTSCPGTMQECIVNVTLPEGNGILQISRLGPYTTRGDFQQVMCVGRGFLPPKGSWLTRSFVGPVDPHTDQPIEFPPLHIHHLVTKSLDHPILPDQIAKYMPMLNFLQSKSSTPSFPSGVSDAQCKENFGGINCLHLKIPEGYGQKTYGTGDDSFLYVHMQDVRRPNSPPLSHYIDYAAIYITELNSNMPVLKTTVHGAIEVIGSDPPPYTYWLKDNTAMYNFATYYMPTTVEFVGNRMHWHSVEDDEAWIVRGTQADLGIPPEVQRPTAKTIGPAPYGLAIEIPGSDSAAFKASLEEHLNAIVAQYDKSISDIDAIHAVENNTFIQLDELPKTHRPSRPPEIRHNVVSKPEGAVSSLNNLLNNFIPEKYRNFEYAGISQELESINIRLTARNEQMKATYTGTLPGMYYRAADTSMQRGQRYQSCDNFTLHPGEHLTVIHFNVPRVPFDELTKHNDEVFNTQDLVQNQHTIFMSNVHLPSLHVL